MKTQAQAAMRRRWLLSLAFIVLEGCAFGNAMSADSESRGGCPQNFRGCGEDPECYLPEIVDTRNAASSCAQRAYLSDVLESLKVENLWKAAGRADIIRCTDVYDFGPAVIVTAERSSDAVEVEFQSFDDQTERAAHRASLPLDAWRALETSVREVVSRRNRVRDQDPIGHAGQHLMLIETVLGHQYLFRIGKPLNERQTSADLVKFCEDLRVLATSQSQ